MLHSIRLWSGLAVVLAVGCENKDGGRFYDQVTDGSTFVFELGPPTKVNGYTDDCPPWLPTMFTAVFPGGGASTAPVTPCGSDCTLTVSEDDYGDEPAISYGQIVTIGFDVPFVDGSTLAGVSRYGGGDNQLPDRFDWSRFDSSYLCEYPVTTTVTY